MVKTFLPSQDLEGLLDLSKFLGGVDAPAALVGADGQVVELPEYVFDVLRTVVFAMQEGKAVSVVPQSQMLTTQQAADYLGISRPTLVKLLESGQLEYSRPGAGRHRRVKLADLLDYEEKHRTKRRSRLAETTKESYESGLYEDDVADYKHALAAARGKA